MVQAQHVREFVHDDGTDQQGAVGTGEDLLEPRRIKCHLAGDQNVGFARDVGIRAAPGSCHLAGKIR